MRRVARLLALCERRCFHAARKILRESTVQTVSIPVGDEPIPTLHMLSCSLQACCCRSIGAVAVWPDLPRRSTTYESEGANTTLVLPSSTQNETAALPRLGMARGGGSFSND